MHCTCSEVNVKGGGGKESNKTPEAKIEMVNFTDACHSFLACHSTGILWAAFIIPYALFNSRFINGSFGI